MPVTYNFALVVMSALIAITAAYIALELANRLLTAKKLRVFWLVNGAIVMGTGIWSMHFVAMLAFSIPIYITYHLPIVLGSLLLAILAAFQALLIISRPQPDLKTLLGGSCSMGIGIALMHYTGMAAMIMPAQLRYQPVVFIASVMIAIVVSFAALKLTIWFSDDRRASNLGAKLATACLMGGAILSMHYTGMAAAVFTHEPQTTIVSSGLDNISLAYIVCTATGLILLMMAVVLLSEPRRSY